MTIVFLLLAILSASTTAAAIASWPRRDLTARGNHAFAATTFAGIAALFVWLALR